MILRYSFAHLSLAPPGNHVLKDTRWKVGADVWNVDPDEFCSSKNNRNSRDQCHWYPFVCIRY